ncbi:hypothetical protein F4678DRAFT_70429 [Xylaria arbuscula]|nr:hypothetical protein F4678DRAFT_70429 [Xylaria arbuscula]
MQLPPHNAERRVHVLHQFIRDNPLGVLTTAIRDPSFPLLQASHIPWVVDEDGCSNNTTSHGRLRGHMARMNPHAKAMVDYASRIEPDSNGTYLEEDVLVVFNGPMHHYITPKFYEKTKPESGKVVPTWNYEAVQVYGKARVHVDTKSEAFGEYLSKQMSDLTKHCETAIMGYGPGGREEARAWEVSDAPSSYIELLKKNLIGIEIEITRVEGRFKMSQEKVKGDRDGVINGIRNLENPIAEPLSQLITDRANVYDGRKNMDR